MNQFDSVNVHRFAQRIEEQHGRLAKLYSKTCDLQQPCSKRQDSVASPSTPLGDGSAEVLSPETFKELGIASEELQVTLEELYQQNEELTAARQALEAERRRYRHLFEFAPESYLVTDTVGKIQEANREAATLLNVSKDFLIGKPLAIFIPVVERQRFRSTLAWLHGQVPGCSRVAGPVRQEWVVQLQPHHREPFPAVLSVVLVCEADLKGDTCNSQLPYSSLEAADLQAPSTLETTVGRGNGTNLLPLPFQSSPPPCTLHWLLRRITTGNHLEARSEQRTGLQARDSSLVSLEECQLQAYHAGEAIPLTPHSVWFISQGLVKLSTFPNDGEEVLVGLAGPSTSFGPGLTSLQTYQAVALSEAQLISISLSEIANSPSLAQRFLPQINRRLQQTESLLAIAGVRKVSERLYQLLQLLKQEIGHPVPQGTRLSVRLTHQDFANACCTTRATITRQFLKLQEQEKISWCPKRHLILGRDF